MVTAVFGLADWWLIRPIPGVSHPNKLIDIEFKRSRDAFEDMQVSDATVRTLTENIQGLRGVAGAIPVDATATLPGQTPQPIDGVVVDGDYFGILGVVPDTGRLFAPEELDPSEPAAGIVLSQSFASELFSQPRLAVGKILRINDADYRVIGVTGGGFRGTDRQYPVDAWFPPAAFAPLLYDPAMTLARPQVTPITHLFGRLRDGVVVGKVEAELGTVMAGVAPPDGYTENDFRTFLPRAYRGLGVPVLERPTVEESLVLLVGIGLVTFLIACANVVNLFLLRAAERRDELWLRSALGASGSHLFKLHITEGIIIGSCGAPFGLAMAYVLTRMLSGGHVLALAPVRTLPLDWRVGLFAAVAALSAGILASGVSYGLRRKDIGGLLARSGRGIVAGDSTVRALLTSLQVALSVGLLIGAATLVATVTALWRIRLGYDTRNVSTYMMRTSRPEDSADTDPESWVRIGREVQSLPGVISAGFAAPDAPLGDLRGVDLRRPGDVTWRVHGDLIRISAGYFRTFGIDLQAGQTFTDSPAGANAAINMTGAMGETDGGPLPVGAIVLGRSVARALFGTQPAVDQPVLERVFNGTRPLIVTGVVGDAKIEGLRRAADPVVYEPLVPAGRLALVVKSSLDEGHLRELIGNILIATRPDVYIEKSATMTERIAAEMHDERFFLRVIGLLAAVAVALAALGVYSVVAYGTDQRRREFGLRLALGATRNNIVWNVLKSWSTMLVTGTAIGYVAGYAFDHLLAHQFTQTATYGTASYFIATAVVGSVSVIACLVPGMRAAHSEPNEVLHAQ